MTAITIHPLQEGLAFGARVRGATLEALRDEEVRSGLAKLFEQAGVLVFEDVEPTGAMHVAISNVAGPLKEHLQKSVPRVDGDAMPGVIDIVATPEEQASIEVEGRLTNAWLPWHFDHCYNDQLNRGGVLRAIEIPPEGGRTGFADGIGLYQAISPELRQRIEGRNVIYKMNVIMDNWRFGRFENYRVLAERQAAYPVMEEMAGKPRAVHPAVWTRETGEKVLHVSPWMAEGIEGAEDAEGDDLLDAVCREIIARSPEHCYFHQWNHSDMVLWDNWRMLHAVEGHHPSHRRRMQRTTIQGDYGLGYFENGGTGDRLLEEMSF